MKRTAVLLLCLACGCTTSSTYSTVLQVAPAKEPGQYVVWAEVREDHNSPPPTWGGGRRSPVITCVPGEPAKASVTSDDGETGEFLEVYIAKPGEDKPSTFLYLRKDDGRVLTRTEVRVPPFAKPPPIEDHRPINAAVAAVDMRTGMVVLNVGSASRPPVQEGYRFLIHRKGDFVAAVRVTAVDAHMCVAEIIPPKPQSAVQVGDRAMTPD